MTARPAETLFLDLDGPILDNTVRLHTLFLDLLPPGCRGVERAAYWRQKRARIAEKAIVARACPALPFDHYRTRRFARIELPRYLRLDRVRPGVKQTLRTLRQSYSIVLVTVRQSRKRLLWQLTAFGLLPLLDDVLSAPAGLRPWQTKIHHIRAYRRRHPTARPIAIIGDTEADILAGQRLQLPTIAVSDGIRSTAYLRSLHPTAICSSFHTVPTTLRRLPRS